MRMLGGFGQHFERFSTRADLAVKARMAASMAGMPIPTHLYHEQQRVLVAIRAHLHNRLYLARCISLAPQLSA